MFTKGKGTEESFEKFLLFCDLPKKMKIFQVYILLCADDSYYVGMTSDIDKRIYRHNIGYYGETSYTASRLPVKLVHSVVCKNFITAMRLEKQLKNWSRAKKEALIKGELKLLPELAKKKFK